MKSLLLVLVRTYQFFLSPWIGGSCRFWPTCSEYAREAITEHGAARGSWMALRRLARCHPYSAGGVDPVPTVTRSHAHCGCRQAQRPGAPVQAAKLLSRN